MGYDAPDWVWRMLIKRRWSVEDDEQGILAIERIWTVSGEGVADGLNRRGSMLGKTIWNLRVCC